MSEQEAGMMLNGIIPMPSNVTVEMVFVAANVKPSIPTPF